MSREVNPRKAAVIGCGFVGSATAFTLMQSRLFSELVLLDVNMEKADGEAKGYRARDSVSRADEDLRGHVGRRGGRGDHHYHSGGEPEAGGDAA